jgi:hypothetical protein
MLCATRRRVSLPGCPARSHVVIEDDLDVLLRHRPLSIAPWSPGHQRHGSQEKSGSYRLALPPLEVPVPT